MRFSRLAAALVAGATTTAQAVSGIEVVQAWARAPAGNGPAALYLTLRDGGPMDRLLAVSTDAGGMAMLHESVVKNGIEAMRDVPFVALMPGATVVMRPGGLHIMLMGMTERLHSGDMLHATLRFDHAAPVTVAVRVFPPGSPGPP